VSAFPRRLRLPNRRSSSTVATRFRGADFAITFSKFCDGRVAEVFVDPHRIGSDLAEAARDVGIVISLALQSGVSLDDLRHSISRAHGTPTSIAGHVLDLVAEEDA
jgi:ribonucleoside-diphosphate reductase alpha chain